jgi:hypothetical protein
VGWRARCGRDVTPHENWRRRVGRIEHHDRRLSYDTHVSSSSCDTEEEGGGVRSGPGAARTILLFHIISARPS